MNRAVLSRPLSLTGLLLALAVPAGAVQVATVGGVAVNDPHLPRKVVELHRALVGRPAEDVMRAEKTLTLRRVRAAVIAALTEQKAAMHNIEASKAAVQKAFAAEVASFPSEQGFDAWLAATGRTRQDFRHQLEKRLVRDALIEKLTQHKPPTAEQAMAKVVAKDQNLSVPARAKVRQILLPMKSDATPAAWAEARRRAEGILRQIRKDPSRFSELCKKYSAGPAKDAGGNLGLVRMGRMPRGFDQAVFTAQKGALLGPVETEHALHIIVVDDLQPPSPPTIEDMAPIVYDQLYGLFERRALPDFYRALFKGMPVEVLVPGVDEDALIPAEADDEPTARKAAPTTGPARASPPAQKKPG